MSFTVAAILPDTLELPHANDITNIVNKANLTTNYKRVEPTEAELEERELSRIVHITNCVTYIFEYIKQTAPTKIFSRVKTQLNNCYVYRYSPPAIRGQKTRYFSQVVYDIETQECRFEYFRPLRHNRNLWYFPIYYMMNGYTKNSERTFHELNINTVEQLLTDYFTNKGYRIKFFRNRIVDNTPTGNLVYVEWDDKSQIKTPELSTKDHKHLESIKVIDPPQKIQTKKRPYGIIKVIEPTKRLEPIKVIEPTKNYQPITKTSWVKAIINKTIRAE
jgi:hypothetical protein